MHRETGQSGPGGRAPADDPLELGERHEPRCAAGGVGELDVQPERGRRATSTVGEQEFPADRGAEGGGKGGGRPRHHDDKRAAGEGDAGGPDAPGRAGRLACETGPQARIGNPGVGRRQVRGRCRARELRRYRARPLSRDRDPHAPAVNLPVQAVEVPAEVAHDRCDVGGGGHVHHHGVAGAGGPGDDGPDAQREQEGGGDHSGEAGQRGCARPAPALRAIVPAPPAPSSVHGIPLSQGRGSPAGRPASLRAPEPAGSSRA